MGKENPIGEIEMAYAENVFRVAKIVETNDGFEIEMSVKGLEYPSIGTLDVKKILSKTTLEDTDRDKIQHTIHVMNYGGVVSSFVFDIIVEPVGLFTIDRIQDIPNGRIVDYICKEVA